MLEAAHFVWRCLRDLGIYARGDDPAPSEIVAERHLLRVRREQSIMTDSSAKMHIDRIRDWRESRIDLF